MVCRGQRLTRQEEFRALNRDGRSWASRLLVLKALPNSSQSNRYGLSVSRRIGNAVLRNRLKRWLREILRTAPLEQGWDILVIVRPAARASTFQDIESATVGLLRRAHLLREDS